MEKVHKLLYIELVGDKDRFVLIADLNKLTKGWKEIVVSAMLRSMKALAAGRVS